MGVHGVVEGVRELTEGLGVPPLEAVELGVAVGELVGVWPADGVALW